MKSLFRLPNLLALAIAIFGFNACSDDPVFEIPPTVSFLAETGFLATDATVAAGSPIRVKINASKGDNPMSSLEFQQDGIRISDISRITIDGTPASSAAVLLFDGDKDSFTKEIEITPHGSGIADYTFVVADEAGETSSVTITITIESAPPSLTAPNGVLALSADAGGLTGLSLMGETSASGATLTTLSVLEGGSVATGTDRFWFGGITAADAFEGIFTLAEGDQDGFTDDLFIRASSTVGTIDSYTIELTDANGLTSTLDITVEAKAGGTPLDMDITGVLLNADGPQGQGGLDLDTGNGDINSTDPAAEIKDEGIDLSQPNASNWKQQISGTPGNSLRFLNPADYPDGFMFESVSSKEAIQGAYDAATAVAVSDEVKVDDVFVVSNGNISGGRLYLLKVTNITLTTDDNKDGYTFSIKW